MLAAMDAARIELKPSLHTTVDFAVFDMHTADLDQ
jgi:hypothetical protein